MYVVCFNGPPESGKDTLSQLLVEHIDSRVTIPVRETSLSLPLRHIAYAMVNRTYSDESYADFKRATFPAFGCTGRQLMIDVSESFLKPTYRKSIMADILVERHRNFDGLLLIRDCGFQLELQPLFDAYGAGNVYVINIMRNGCDFSHDSREWVLHKTSSRHQMQVPNNGTLDDLAIEAGRIYGRMVNQLGWTL